ncbi:MAG TPA: hypothetical protein VH599_13405 [Ktedonobacterales bacterium]
MEPQLQNTVGQIAHQLDRDPWPPAPEQADQLVSVPAQRFVAQPQLLFDVLAIGYYPLP